MAALEGQSVASGELPIGLRALIDAGVHFGHQTKRWNPKMRPYIYGARNGIHIVDLDQTAQLFKRAYHFVADTVARGGHVLFVGTKRQAAEVIYEEATRAGQFHVTGRWLGGTLTNFRTMKINIERLRDLERRQEDGTFEMLTKKEALSLTREMEKLEKYLGGIKMMNAIPSALFVIDPNHEHIALREARRLHIPIIALTDTNCDPDLVDFHHPRKRRRDSFDQVGHRSLWRTHALKAHNDDATADSRSMKPLHHRAACRLNSRADGVSAASVMRAAVPLQPAHRLKEPLRAMPLELPRRPPTSPQARHNESAWRDSRLNL